MAWSWCVQGVFSSFNFPYLWACPTWTTSTTRFSSQLWFIMWSSIFFHNLKKQCWVYLLHLTLQMRWNIWINAENNRSFDPNGEARSLLAAMFVVPRLPRDFRTCAIWFTLSRAACEPIDKCEMNFRWIVQIFKRTSKATEYEFHPISSSRYILVPR